MLLPFFSALCLPPNFRRRRFLPCAFPPLHCCFAQGHARERVLSAARCGVPVAACPIKQMLPHSGRCKNHFSAMQIASQLSVQSKCNASTIQVHFVGMSYTIPSKLQIQLKHRAATIQEQYKLLHRPDLAVISAKSPPRHGLIEHLQSGK